MPSPFHAAIAAADRVVDGVNAEAFAFQPKLEIVNGDPVPDPGRQAVPELMAIFDDPAERLVPAGQSGGMPGRVASSPEISLLDTALPEPPRRPDRFVRALDGKVYEVRQALPDGMGRTDCQVAEVAEG